MDNTELSDTEKAKAYGIDYKLWHGMPSFKCPYCPYSNLKFSRLLEHANQHLHKVPLEKVTTEKLVDVNGNSMEYVQPEPEQPVKELPPVEEALGLEKDSGNPTTENWWKNMKKKKDNMEESNQ